MYRPAEGIFSAGLGALSSQVPFQALAHVVQIDPEVPERSPHRVLSQQAFEQTAKLFVARSRMRSAGWRRCVAALPQKNETAAPGWVTAVINTDEQNVDADNQRTT